MSDIKIYQLNDKITIQSISDEIEAFLQVKKERITSKIHRKDGCLILTKELFNIKKIIGVEKSILVDVSLLNEKTIQVRVRVGDEADRIGLCGLNWGLKIIPGYYLIEKMGKIIGVNNQDKLPTEIFDCIDAFVKSNGLSAYKDFGKRCTKCGVLNPPKIKSCVYCGEHIE